MKKKSFKKAKGTLILVLGIMLFLFIVETVFLCIVRNSREKIVGVKNRHTAKSLARVGLDYTLSMLEQGKWTPNHITPSPGKVTGDLVKVGDKVCLRESFSSAVLARPGGIFEAGLYSHEGKFFRVECTGIMGHSKFRLTREFPENSPAIEFEEIRVIEIIPESTETPEETETPMETETPGIPAESPSPGGETLPEPMPTVTEPVISPATPGEVPAPLPSVY